MVGKVCEYCEYVEEKNEGMLKCSACRHSHYCSKECQKKDWKRHKQLCIPPEPLSKEESQFHKYAKEWRGRVQMHTLYLLSKEFGPDIIRNGKRPSKLLCIDVSFDATVSSIKAHEAYTVDWKYIGGDLKTLFDRVYTETCHIGFRHAIGVVWKGVTICNPFIVPRKPNIGAFENVEACLKAMGEIKKKPRAPIIRRIQNGLSQLGQLDEWKIFFRSAFNMDTEFPLNQTHSLVVTIKTENGNLIQLVSFQLLKNLAEYVADSDLDLLKSRRGPNTLLCLFVEQGILSSTMFAESIASEPKFLVWKSQDNAREHFQKVNDSIQKSKLVSIKNSSKFSKVVEF